MRKLLFYLLIIILSSPVQANDVLKLKNELVFEGKVTRIKRCTVLFTSNRQRYEIPATEILFIHFGDTDDKVYKDYLIQSEKDPNTCLNGWLDAKNYHGKKEVHFILGFLFGPYAMVATALANPTPQKGVNTMMNSTNKDQFSDPEYLRCYRRKAKAELITMEAIGSVAMLAVVGIALLASWGANSH